MNYVYKTESNENFKSVLEYKQNTIVLEVGNSKTHD